MLPQNSYCVLQVLVRSFATEYFSGKLSSFHKGLLVRIDKYRKELDCSRIDNLKEDDLIALLSDLWALQVHNMKTRYNLLRNEINNLRSRIKSLSCGKTNYSGGVLRVYKNLGMEKFKLSFWSELACLLHPDKFFIVNNKVRDALKILIQKQVIPKGGFSALSDKDKELEELMGAVLKFLKEVNSNANYLDVDAFLYFVAEVERKRRGEQSGYVEEIERAMSKQAVKVLDDWIDQAKKVCELSDPCAEISKGVVEGIGRALEMRGQTVLYGVPGTGKTFIARCVAQKLVGSRGRTEFVTFHPSYSYEEFIEGIRPKIVEKDGIKLMEFYIEHGVFKRISALATCELLRTCGIVDITPELGTACGGSSRNGSKVPHGEIDIDAVLEGVAANLDSIRKKLREVGLDRCVNESRHVLVVDEINRGDMARVFGELITLLEKDKRLFGENEIIATLSYSKRPFFVPPNLYIIGTMNSADRSIAFVDYALRRRFAFIELEPDRGKVPDKVEGLEGFDLRDFFDKLNRYLEKEIDRDHRVGHSYFMNVKTVSDLKRVWFTQIRPLLMEYFYGRDDDVKDKLDELYTKPFIESDDEFRKKLENALKKLG